MLNTDVCPTPRRRRILLSAFAFDHSRGSEAGLGWEVAHRIAATHDVTVIFGNLKPAPSDPENLRLLHEACDRIGNLHPVLVEASPHAKRIARFSNRTGFWWLYYHAYRLWQLQALEIARAMHIEKPFDLVHHLNIVGFREPGYLWTLGIPFFWGPISGSPMVPLSFLRTFSPGQIYRWGGRNLANAWQMRASIRCRRAARAATSIWTVSESDRRMVTECWGRKARPFLEIGAAPKADSKPRRRDPSEPLRIVWSGRFDSIKVLPVLFRALERLQGQPWELNILGDGPEASRWHRAEKKAELSGRVIWHGMLTRCDALRTMENCHVLAHTSVKEATATVLIEALERGMPVVCHDACGMGIAIDERCGIKIPLRDPQTSASGFADALSRFFREPELLSRLSEGALLRASELNWSKKIKEFTDAYNTI
jgi:glycosyltransferase involved in cell wall biosynthesis